LMNKGLEVLEASALFGIEVERVNVVVHPQSIVHSMVEYVDGAVIAQLSRPDMRLPIAYCLGAPVRLEHGWGQIDFSQSLTLEFEAPDREAFGALDLAYEASRLGEPHPRGCPPRMKWRSRRSSTTRSNGRASYRWSLTCSISMSPTRSTPSKPSSPTTRPPVDSRALGCLVDGIERDRTTPVSETRSLVLFLVGVAGLAALLTWWGGWALPVVIGAIVLMVMGHEFGHYLTAKRAGMKVTDFFVGFGPVIWSTTRGDTRYGVRALLLGGYVKVPGMTWANLSRPRRRSVRTARPRIRERCCSPQRVH